MIELIESPFLMPLRDDVLPLEEVDLAVVYAHVADVVCDFHSGLLHFYYF